MKDIEEKLALFRLADQSIKSVMHAIDLANDEHKGPATYTVETVVVHNGEAKVISKEVHNV
ncbi:hypothetical protein THIX_70188 [Thiomonas sp. X19]|uniref:hypothetical protein n=1 Tax=Thiomonas sp. X19 TaxID=1050370 RepID=UPI000B6E68AB|nr:hypothetical protein [Thiomonas sp. X19]SCC95159.1 hypothetical protein THIX_70188 [Thiomonas sp. X19]